VVTWFGHLKNITLGAPDPKSFYLEMIDNLDFQSKMLQYADSIILTGEQISNFKCQNESCTTCKSQKFNQYTNQIPSKNSASFLCEMNQIQQNALSSYQIHSHTPSCYKIKSIKGCRFRKPDKTYQHTTWNCDTGYD